MSRPLEGPPASRLRHYVDRGMTQQQMVEAWETESGHRVSRSAIAMSLARNDLKSAHPRPRYDDMLPWVVAVEHYQHIDARMLRLEGRRRAGGKLDARQQRWLDGWKASLEEAHAVVHYDRNTEEGFFWVDIDEAIEPDGLIDRGNVPKGGGATYKPMPAAQRRD